MNPLFESEADIPGFREFETEPNPVLAAQIEASNRAADAQFNRMATARPLSNSPAPQPPLATGIPMASEAGEGASFSGAIGEPNPGRRVKPPVEGAEKQLPIRQRISADLRVKKAVAGVVTARQQFQADYDALNHLIDPEGALRGMVKSIHAAGSPAEIVALQNKAAGLLDALGAAGKERARQLLRSAYTPLQRAIEQVFDAADAVLGDLRNEAAYAERKLFEEFGMAYEKTAVSRRIDAVAAEIAGMRSGGVRMIAGGNLPMRSAGGHVVAYFEVK